MTPGRHRARLLLFALAAGVALAVLVALLRPARSASSQAAANTATTWVLAQDRFTKAQVRSSSCATGLDLNPGARADCEVRLYLAGTEEVVGVQLVALDDRGATAFEYTALSFPRRDLEERIGTYLLESVLTQLGPAVDPDTSLSVRCTGAQHVLLRRDDPYRCTARLEMGSSSRDLEVRTTLTPAGDPSITAT